MHNQSTIQSLLDKRATGFEFCNILSSNRHVMGALVKNYEQQAIIDELSRDKLINVCLASKEGRDTFFTPFTDDLTVDDAKSDIAFLNSHMDHKMHLTYEVQAFIYNQDRIDARNALFGLHPDIIKSALIASNAFNDKQAEIIKASNAPFDFLSNNYLCEAFGCYLQHTKHGLNTDTLNSVIKFVNDSDGLFLPRIYNECGCYGFRDGRIWLISSCDCDYSAEVFASADRNNTLAKWAIVAYI